MKLMSYLQEDLFQRVLSLCVCPSLSVAFCALDCSIVQMMLVCVCTHHKYKLCLDSSTIFTCLEQMLLIVTAEVTARFWALQTLVDFYYEKSN